MRLLELFGLRKKVEEKAEPKAEFKPSLEEANRFLHETVNSAFGRRIHDGEKQLAEWLAQKGFVRIENGCAFIVNTGIFRCESCVHFSEKKYSYKMPSGAVVEYQGLQRFCDVHGFMMSNIHGERGRACGDWSCKRLMEELVC
ncbi:MAG: hypothetical protein QW175_07220 [Candidatus Bathyarchaeia archaeon]